LAIFLSTGKIKFPSQKFLEKNI